MKGTKENDMVDLQSVTLQNHFTSRVGTDFYSSKRLQTLFFLTSFPGTVCLICFAQIASTFLHPNSTVQRCQNWIQKDPRFWKKTSSQKYFFFTIALTPHALSMCIMVCLFLNGTVAVTVHIEPLIAALSFMLISLRNLMEAISEAQACRVSELVSMGFLISPPRQMHLMSTEHKHLDY